MITISKEFQFDYGHRVWNQELNSDFSLDNKLVCRHLHGHRGRVVIYLSAHLDQPKELLNGMITDFKHLNWFKKFVDEHIDHKFIIDSNDPLFDRIVGEKNTFSRKEITVEGIDCLIGSTIKADSFDGVIKEHLESFLIVDFVPTSENLAKWLHRIVREKMRALNVEVPKILFKETPKTEAWSEL